MAVLHGGQAHLTLRSRNSAAQALIGRLATILSGTTNYASTFAYNPAGQVTGFNYGNGVTASFTYSPERLALATLRYSKGATDLLNLTYGYTQNGGNNGQITSITDNVDPTRSMTYSYDPLGRLKVAFAGPEATPTWKLDWDYDRYGNRPNQNVRAGSPPGPQLTIDPNTNRITGTGYSYDANDLPPIPAQLIIRVGGIVIRAGFLHQLKLEI